MALFSVAVASVGIMLVRVGYADSRAEVRQPDLQRLYREVNRDSFQGKLPDIPVSWGDLTKDDAYGITHFDKEMPYGMEVDRKSVRTESFAMDVIRHESCHIATIHEVKRRKEDPHGATFVECMSRVQDGEKEE